METLSFGKLALEYNSPDSKLETKLAGILSAGPVRDAMPEAKNWRIRKVGDRAPAHVRADPIHWGEPGGLDDLLDQITDARRDTTQTRYRKTEKGKEAKSRYRKSEAHKEAKTRHRKTPGHKASKKLWTRKRDKKRTAERAAWPFIGIDTEGVNLVNQSWIENADTSSAEAWLASDDPNEAIYTPQKIVVLAVGNAAHIDRLCHAAEGADCLGKYAPALSSEEMLDKLCDLPTLRPRNKVVWFGGSYDAAKILNVLPYELKWELQNQVPFGDLELPEDEQHNKSISRPVFWILYDASGKPRKDL